jgi:flagellar protein FlaG
MKVEAQQFNELTKLSEVRLDQKAVLKTEKLNTKEMQEIIDEAKLQTEKLVREDSKLDPKKLQEFVDALNRFLLAFDQKFKFRIYEDTNQLWVRIMDVETDEVIREIPSQDALKLASRIKEFVGLLIDEYR